MNLFIAGYKGVRYENLKKQGYVTYAYINNHRGLFDIRQVVTSFDNDEQVISYKLAHGCAKPSVFEKKGGAKLGDAIKT